MQVCPAVEECLANISWTRNSVLAASRNHFEFVKRRFRDPDGNYQLKALKSNIVTVPIEMLLSRGNPLLNRINQILLQVLESGLISHWQEIVTSRQASKTGEKVEKILTLDTLSGGFILWFIGVGLSMVVFLGEMVHFKWR